MADIPLRVVIDAQAKLDGFQKAQTAVANLQTGIATQMERTVRAQKQSVDLAQRQEGFFRRLAGSFSQAVGIPKEGLSRAALLAGAGGVIGAAAGGIVAGAAYSVANAFREVVVRGMELADQLGDMAEQLGISREDMMRLRTGAAGAGIPQRTAIRSLSTIGQLRGLAMSGDAEAMGLFEAYGISRGTLNKAPSNLYLANLVRSKLGDEGATAADDAALRRILGPQYRAMLTALGKMSQQSPILEETMQRADRLASAKEYADTMRDVRRMEATAQWWNPLKYVAADSAKRYADDMIEAMKKIDSAAESIGPRTAGFWRPPKVVAAEAKANAERENEAEQARRPRREAAFDLNEASVSPSARRGLFASAADWRLWTSQLSVSKQQLEELKAIRNALTAGLKVEV